MGRFNGELDIKTLGGAGFASQRTTGDRTWDLSEHAGIVLDVTESDCEWSCDTCMHAGSSSDPAGESLMPHKADDNNYGQLRDTLSF